MIIQGNRFIIIYIDRNIFIVPGFEHLRYGSIGQQYIADVKIKARQIVIHRAFTSILVTYSFYSAISCIFFTAVSTIGSSWFITS